ncbi:aromatic ring-hydroxylating oxygenase subunit alpha [Pigmentiphaga litoralis]|uniref:Phenylpropionate dioxygenase-like ring-hydroxylating dioxygenase large terminal subunit n=1 Tax=Pigmentiphaga litoralis TaxID=516702 RepID=A0A7Y9LND3_9BURK|nr:aromatic ring-hydroxylating dioxygenase subunit alpha [Pigmentiphaga litoralis]NYE26731.1 phenylpropionate dioxygenase-like ring-hydroxylating dioxygenase large terminal subunit [Pigmentiphaga litoralis]NYE85859.1 phenylpropionate dioxygenase-like ring-hydroxylating dioxygenase large terminal subunit [Pigmentiphaga litoralis]
MTDIGRVEHVAASRAQLPVSAYFDDARFKREMQSIFSRSPNYVGHRNNLPEVGDYRTLAQENDGRVLVRNQHGVELVSNVCRHRQAVMLGKGSVGSDGARRYADAPTTGNLGVTGNIVCPLHRWTYNGQGKLIGAPLFGENPCLDLERFPLQEWNGSLFEAPRLGDRHAGRELSALLGRPEFDLSDYVLDRVETHVCHYNWKTFIEVYLEDYHVGPFHPGLGRFVTCDDLSWEFNDFYSLQKVGVHQDLEHPGSSVYQRWHDKVLDYRNGEPPDFGAIWVTHFPTHMIELYPHTLVLSTLYPKGPQETVNMVEFYYPEDIVHFEREFVEAQQAAYMETAVEDDEIAERMDAGRRILLERGTNEVGPYQSPMEDGMQHFHEWYRSAMNEPENL